MQLVSEQRDRFGVAPTYAALDLARSSYYRRSRLLRGLLPLVQHRASPRRTGALHAARRASWARRGETGAESDGAGQSIREPSGTIPAWAPDGEGGADGRVDQPAGEDRGCVGRKDHDPGVGRCRDRGSASFLRGRFRDRPFHQLKSHAGRTEHRRCSVISRTKCLKLVDRFRKPATARDRERATERDREDACVGSKVTRAALKHARRVRSRALAHQTCATSTCPAAAAPGPTAPAASG